jgi:cytochrome c peroxidase
LFYDGRLTGKVDTLMSCATCHHIDKSFENGIGYGYGVTGIQTPHVMLPMINLVFNSSGYFWNGKISASNPNEHNRTLEDVVYLGLTAPHELHSDSVSCKNAIQNIPMYPPMFKKAFGSDVVTFKNIAKAIAQFVRTLISADSKFDRYLRGEAQLNASELKGYMIFNTEKGDCFHCHGTILFTTNQFYNNATDSVFNDPRDRFAITGDPKDHGAYKATTLRNIELTGPYMRDGRFATLDQVINHYSEGLVWSPYVHPLMKKINDGGIQLTPTEKADLKAFIHTLMDSTFITNPAFKNPF